MITVGVLLSLCALWVAVVLVIMPVDARDELRDILFAPLCLIGRHKWEMTWIDRRTGFRAATYLHRKHELAKRCTRCGGLFPLDEE